MIEKSLPNSGARFSLVNLPCLVLASVRRAAVLGPRSSACAAVDLQRPTGSLAGRCHGVPFRVRASHLLLGQSGPKRHGIPFKRLTFVTLFLSSFTGNYNTIIWVVWRGVSGLVHRQYLKLKYTLPIGLSQRCTQHIRMEFYYFLIRITQNNR